MSTVTGKVLFMVRRKYFDLIRVGFKRVEVRKATPKWITTANGGPSEAVFVCGGQVHRRQVLSHTIVDSAHEALGRELDDGERRDLGTGRVVVFLLGDEILDAQDDSDKFTRS
ncbi:MAG: hypothetical protein ACLQD8_04340 [Thermoplasmata archaeon]